MEEFLVSDKEKCAINALFNVSEETLESKVKSLKEWIDQCPQLPLESKGSVLVREVMN
jgi:vacuolar-type H+-ATPase subunit E/Vma4